MSTEPNEDGCVTPQQRQDMLLTHVTLPRYLPQDISPHLDRTDLQLLHEMAEIVVAPSEIVPPQTVKLFESLRRVHEKIQVDANTISFEINALRPGDTFAVFVRRQRWMFMIHVPPNDDENAANSLPHDVIAATFPGNVRPSEIYKHDSDIAVIFLIWKI